jgi:hypothetical protein
MDYRGLAEKAAGNWSAWPNFAWWRKPRDPERWAIFNVRHRDSDLTDVSNHVAIAKALDRFDDGDNPTVIWQDHSHWAVGWVTALCIRVRHPSGCITKAFKVWCELQERKENYPILDEVDYSNREYDAALDGIREQGRRHVIDNPPDDWPARVFDWLWQHNDRELENRDDRGAYPNEDAVREALVDLGLLDADA